MLDNWLKVAIPFVAGLQTKAATAVVPPDQLAVLQNGVFTKQGAVAKRFGNSAMPDYTGVGLTGTIEGTKRGLFDGNGAVTLATSTHLYSRAGTAWHERGRYAAVTYRAEEVAHANRNHGASDSATVNGVTAVVWKYAADSLYFQLFDAESVPLSPVTALATATADLPSALAVGDNLLLMYFDTSTDDLKARVIRTANITDSIVTATVVTVRSDLTGDGLYSINEGPDGYGLVTWYSDGTAGVNGVCVCKVNSGGTGSSAQSVSTDATTLPPAVAYDPENDDACVAWATTGSNVFYQVLDAATLTGGTPEDTGVVSSGRIAVAPTLDDAQFSVAAEVIISPVDRHRVHLCRVGTATVHIVRHAYLASRGFTMAEHGCFVLGHESRTGLQNSYYLYADDAYLLGAFEQSTATDRSATNELPGLSGGNLVLRFQRSLDVDDYKAQYSHAGTRLLRFDESGRVSTARLGNTTYLSGCQLWAYDGDQPVEAGMHMFPDVAEGGTCTAGDGGTVGDFTQLAAGANLANATQYNYRFYYEWYNSRGERCRSLPMQRSVTTSIASCELSINVPTIRHTLKSATYGRQAEVSIVVYRTQGNMSDVYFRVSSPNPDATGDNGYLANRFDADWVTFVDDLADADIVDNERDMFSLAELLSSPVPGPEVLYATQDRLYLAGGSIPPGSVLPSKQHEPGDMVEIAFENEARPCTDDVVAFGSINEVVVAFTERQTHALSGPGFDNGGGGSPFGTGRVTSDVGCTQPGSVVMVPGGLLFKSAKGIYGMDQSFNVEYLGAPVERYNAQTIHAACVVPDTNYVLFTAETGYTLMFDSLYGQWGTFTGHLGTDACVVNDDYAFLRTDGVVMVRDVTSYTDAGAAVILKFRTGRFRGEELQGQIMLRTFGVLGEYKSPHSLIVRLYYDRNEFPSWERTVDVMGILNTSSWGSDTDWGDSEYWGGSGGIPDYRFVLRPRRTKFSQLAFEFEDAITEEAGASFELTELLLEVMPMDGIQNTSARRKA